MFDEFLTANADYASRFTHGSLTARARKGLCIVTCMDTRIDPLAILGMAVGDAKVLRNAGGRVTPDVLRSLVLATNLLGVGGVAVMHHTGCALAGPDDSQVSESLPAEQRRATSDWVWWSMPDLDAALADDVAAVRSCAGLAPGVAVEGWRYDVQTGRVSRVITA